MYYYMGLLSEQYSASANTIYVNRDAGSSTIKVVMVNYEDQGDRMRVHESVLAEFDDATLTSLFKHLYAEEDASPAGLIDRFLELGYELPLDGYVCLRAFSASDLDVREMDAEEWNSECGEWDGDEGIARVTPDAAKNVDGFGETPMPLMAPDCQVCGNPGCGGTFCGGWDDYEEDLSPPDDDDCGWDEPAGCRFHGEGADCDCERW